jgi:hypothetical protein
VGAVLGRIGALHLIAAGIVVSALAPIVLAVARDFWSALLALSALTLAIWVSVTTLVGERQRHAPHHLQARVGITGGIAPTSSARRSPGTPRSSLASPSRSSSSRAHRRRGRLSSSQPLVRGGRFRLPDAPEHAARRPRRATGTRRDRHDRRARDGDDDRPSARFASARRERALGERDRDDLLARRLRLDRRQHASGEDRRSRIPRVDGGRWHPSAGERVAPSGGERGDGRARGLRPSARALPRRSAPCPTRSEKLAPELPVLVAEPSSAS